MRKLRRSIMLLLCLVLALTVVTCQQNKELQDINDDFDLIELENEGQAHAIALISTELKKLKYKE